VRCLPSAEELALLSPMLADAGWLAYASTPFDPSSPSPLRPTRFPADMSVGLAAFLAFRQRRTGSELASASFLTHFDTAANPEFTNATFDDAGTGWSTTGDVVFENGTAILKETAGTQTRLNQVFVVSETDRILSFTLAGIALDDVDNGPDDALKIALIDANTGLSLLGGVGLSKTDAILNL
jgi:hypothetical protein